MRIAFAGKGGTGKTTLAAALARSLARAGTEVVAIDADSNPNLAVALGIEREHAARPAGLPSTIVSRRLDAAPGLSVTITDVLSRYALRAPDDVRLLSMGMPGHADEGCMCGAHATVSAVLHDLGREIDTVTVIDLEASPEHLSRGTARHVDVLVLVTEPYYRSLESVRRLAVLARELPIPRLGAVANKVRSPEDIEAIREFCERSEIELLGSVPWTDDVREADRLGVPIVDRDGCGEVVDAIKQVFARAASPEYETS